jgi:hypothetical protein
MEPDIYYNQNAPEGGGAWDQISTIFHAPVTTSDGSFTLKSSIYGRNYDSDPAKPGTWGLLNRQTLTGQNDPPWLIKHGLAPEFTGSPEYFSFIEGVWTPKPASYLSFEIELDTNHANEAVLFEEVSMRIAGLYNTDGDTDIWATTNQNGFQSAINPVISAEPDVDSDIYTFDFGVVNLVGKKLEVRIYGVLGQDQGYFGSAILGGTISPVPLPEPSMAALGLFGLLSCTLKRRRPNSFSC